jgi:hypothetical protein
VTFEALGGVGLRVERDRMNRRPCSGGKQRDQHYKNAGLHTRLVASQVGNRLVQPDAIKELSHTAFEGSSLEKVAGTREESGKVDRGQAAEGKRILSGN